MKCGECEEDIKFRRTLKDGIRAEMKATRKRTLQVENIEFFATSVGIRTELPMVLRAGVGGGNKTARTSNGGVAVSSVVNWINVELDSHLTCITLEIWEESVSSQISNIIQVIKQDSPHFASWGISNDIY